MGIKSRYLCEPTIFYNKGVEKRERNSRFEDLNNVPLSVCVHACTWQKKGSGRSVGGVMPEKSIHNLPKGIFLWHQKQQ